MNWLFTWNMAAFWLNVIGCLEACHDHAHERVLLRRLLIAGAIAGGIGMLTAIARIYP